MDRAERAATAQASDFSLFQTTIILEEQVRGRTAELEAALRENERIERVLRESEAKFRGLVSQSMVGIGMIEDGKFTYSNAKFDEIFGYTADEVRSLGPLDVAVPEDRPIVAENVRKKLSGEVDSVDYVFRGLRKNGEVVDIESHGSGMDIGGKKFLISLILDISKRARAEREVLALQERLREESTHDALTGLYNRRYLEEALSRELILAQREGHPVSVIMGDLDHFKAVNDHYGHLAGDEVLRAFGVLMKGHARASDIYCRYGGEEFLLVLPRMPQHAAVERAEQMRVLMGATPVSHDSHLIKVTASFGVAEFPRDGQTGDTLIAAADCALYEAKEAGRDRVALSPAVACALC
jgi:diguanylate cyclase (GGDEF)-like protein/PAS domain S-box-containing protein